jgi:hypothetical protein
MSKRPNKHWPDRRTVATEVEKAPVKTEAKPDSKSAQLAPISEKPDPKKAHPTDAEKKSEPKSISDTHEKTLENTGDKSARVAPITEIVAKCADIQLDEPKPLVKQKAIMLGQDKRIFEFTAEPGIDLNEVIKDIKKQLVQTPPSPYFILPYGVSVEVK